MSIHLHIERLVVEGLGLARADAPRLAAALETELAARLAADGADQWRARSADALPRRDIQLQAGDGPSEIGRSLGASLSLILGGQGRPFGPGAKE
jgi:hypothetical protein